jgi:hypothetical protein
MLTGNRFAESLSTSLAVPPAGRLVKALGNFPRGTAAQFRFSWTVRLCRNFMPFAHISCLP